MYDEKRITYSQMVVTANKPELENEEGKVGDVQAKSTQLIALKIQFLFLQSK